MRLLAKALYIIFGLVVYARLAEHWRGDSGMIIRLVIVLLLSFIATLIHELGHAAAAIRVGGNISKIAVLPFEYRVATRELRFARNTRHPDLGGFVAYKIDRIDPLKRHAIVAVAGPVATVALAIIAGVVGLNLSEDSASAAVLTALAVLSVAMAVANMIPFRGSDGALMLNAMRRRQAATRKEKMT